MDDLKPRDIARPPGLRDAVFSRKRWVADKRIDVRHSTRLLETERIRPLVPEHIRELDHPVKRHLRASKLGLHRSQLGLELGGSTIARREPRPNQIESPYALLLSR